MKVKTSELIGRALNWAAWVATGDFVEPDLDGGYDGIGNYSEPWSPSTNWAQGGPIKEQERIISGPHGLGFVAQITWDASLQWFGPTELVAAMRCYVANRLGEEVDVPEELLK